MKNENSLVSICTPIYGVEKYIERCAVSLLEQTYSNIEYIFVDDCTKDSSIEILKAIIKQYPQRESHIKIIKHNVNKGLAAARNTGLDNATGKYLMHVDADDFLVEDAIEQLVDLAETESAEIIIFGYYILNVKNKQVKHISYDKEHKDDYIKSILLHHTPASIWNKFFNLEFLKRTGIRSIEGLNHGEDYAIVPRLLHKARIVSCLDRPLYYYERSNINSYTNNIKPESVYNLIQADDILINYFSDYENSETFRDILDAIYTRTMLTLIKTSTTSQYGFIYSQFSSKQCSSSCLSVSDQLIIYLLSRRQYFLLSLIMGVYKKLL